MLTIIEKMQQRSLKKQGALIYPVTYKVQMKNGTVSDHTVHIYANNKEDAQDLGNKIQLRATENINSGGALADWGFNVKHDLKSSKLGAIVPWLNPVNKRSYSNGIKQPARRALESLKSLRYYATTQRTIEQSELNREQINRHLTKTVYSMFTTFAMAVMGVYLLIKAFMSNDGSIYNYGVSALLVFVFCFFTTVQLVTNRKRFLKWREDLNE